MNQSDFFIKLVKKMNLFNLPSPAQLKSKVDIYLTQVPSLSKLAAYRYTQDINKPCVVIDQ